MGTREIHTSQVSREPCPRPARPRAPRFDPCGAVYAPDTRHLSDQFSILVAEDHPDSRDALRTLLEACGYRVVVAVDGEEAVRRAVENHPDLILMDLMMPGVDGLEATRRLRRESAFRDIPIVALTAMEGGRERALDVGFDDFMSKPINLPVFLHKLDVWLHAREPKAE